MTTSFEHCSDVEGCELIEVRRFSFKILFGKGERPTVSRKTANIKLPLYPVPTSSPLVHSFLHSQSWSHHYNTPVFLFLGTSLPQPNRLRSRQFLLLSRSEDGKTCDFPVGVDVRASFIETGQSGFHTSLVAGWDLYTVHLSDGPYRRNLFRHSQTRFWSRGVQLLQKHRPIPKYGVLRMDQSTSISRTRYGVSRSKTWKRYRVLVL